MSTEEEKSGTNPFPYLRTKLQIGSASSNLNYTQEETVFHPDSIPPKVREAKAAVAEWAKPDILGLQKLKWDNRIAPRQLCVREKKAIGAHDGPQYAYNYRAEKLPPKRPMPSLKKSKFQVTLQNDEDAQLVSNQKLVGTTRLEMPVHPALEDKHFDLNSSFNRSIAKQQFDITEERRKKNTERHLKRLESNPSSVSLTDRFAVQLERTREQKRASRQEEGRKQEERERWGYTTD